MSVRNSPPCWNRTGGPAVPSRPVLPKLKLKLFTLVVSCCVCFAMIAHAQPGAKYGSVDALIRANTMADALDALRELKENHSTDTADAEYWLRYARASRIFSKFDDAAAGINRAIRLSPAGAEYYFEKGLLYNETGKPDSALIALSKAIAVTPAGEYYYWRGIMYQQLAQNDSAEADYRKALASRYEGTYLYNNMAILLAEKSRFSDALRMVNNAIRLNPRYAAAYSARSKINLYLLNVDSACADRRAAIRLGHSRTLEIPDSVCRGDRQLKLYFAASVLAANGQYTQAISALNTLIGGNRPQSRFLLTRGYSYFRTGDYINAEKDYLHALSLPQPAADMLYDDLSLLYFEQGQFQKAAAYSTKRIALDSLNPVPYLDRGLSYRKLKMYGNAEQDFNKCLEIQPDFFRAFGYRAFLFLETGRKEDAFKDSNEAIRINPEYGYGYLVRAEIRRALGAPDVCPDLQKALRYGEAKAAAGINEYCK